MANSVINAYLVRVSFFAFPVLGSGEHELIFASSREPNEYLSEEIVAALGGKQLGKRLDRTRSNSGAFVALDRGDTTADYRWRFRGEYEDATKTDNHVTATLKISDLGNLLTEAGRDVHYIDGRLRYAKEGKMLPIYSSAAEIPD